MGYGDLEIIGEKNLIWHRPSDDSLSYDDQFVSTKTRNVAPHKHFPL